MKEAHPQNQTSKDYEEILKIKDGTWKFYSNQGELEKTITYNYKEDFWSCLLE